MSEPSLINPPREGVWRLGRGPDPLQMRRPDPADTSNPGAGHRFDSFDGNFAVLYGATSPEACYAVDSVPADRRNSRVLARVVVNDALPFLDVAHPDTLASFREEIRISSWLESFGVGDLVALPDDTVVLPGHGRSTTIGAERPQLDDWIARS